VSRASAIRLFWTGAAATFVVAALLALSAVLGGSFDSTDWKILGALGTLVLGGAVATAGVSLRETDRAETFGTVLAFGGPALALIGLFAMVRDYEPRELGKLAGIAYVLLTAGLIVGTARILARQRSQQLPFAVVALTASVAALLAVVGIADGNGGHWKAGTASLILMTLAYVLIPLWPRLAGSTVTTTTTDSEVAAVDLAQGVAVSGVQVRLASPGATTLGHDTVVFVLTGRAVAGSSTVAPGYAVFAPAGTTFELTPAGGAILIGR
jgi:hypothetical membrane protein